MISVEEIRIALQRRDASLADRLRQRRDSRNLHEFDVGIIDAQLIAFDLRIEEARDYLTEFADRFDLAKLSWAHKRVFAAACMVCGCPELGMDALKADLGIDFDVTWTLDYVSPFKHREAVHVTLGAGPACVIAVNQHLYSFVHADEIFGRLIDWLPIIQSTISKVEAASTAVFALGDASMPGAISGCSNDRKTFLIPDPIFMYNRAYQNFRTIVHTKALDWAERRDVVFWRGSDTGLGHIWQELPRVVLCQRVDEANRPDIFDVGISQFVQVPNASRDAIIAKGYHKPYVRNEELINYRYHIDIDGNTNSWPGLFLKLLSGSPVFKVASPHGFRQWYYDRLEPWIHYVPVEPEMRDLVEKVLWLRQREDRARSIGQRAQQLAFGMTFETEVQRGSEVAVAAYRAHAGLALADLRFGAEGNARASLRQGWAGDAATTYEWTLDDHAVIELAKPPFRSDLILHLQAFGNVGPDLPAQRVAVIVNGHHLKEISVAHEASFTIPIPSGVVEARPRLTLLLVIPDAASANRTGRWDDLRILGIAVQRLRLTVA
ncbi:glycosyl transferase family 90 [Methylobacterium segetis]|uniref:glycosyl transferase family 90 n=1 Tax=Methylobacterium segetis TaxID=2488750 RepID=UPI0010484F79|nr:glycosyl transferase family 90 [Methylobacterium segetis]